MVTTLTHQPEPARIATTPYDGTRVSGCPSASWIDRWGYDAICCWLLASIALWVGRYYFTVSGESFALHHEDDVQYYLKIAQNLSHGFPFTFDRLEPTNGFHPLWVLVLQPLCWCFHNPEQLVRAAFILQFLIFAACVPLLYITLLTVTDGSRLIAFCISLYFGLDHYFYKTIINGLETPLFVFPGLLPMLMLSRLHSAQFRNARALALIGLLGGLTILSRLDGGFVHVALFAVVFAVIFWRRLTFGTAAAAALTCLVPVTTFVALSTWYNGSPWPVSGLVKMMLATGPADHSLLAILDFPNLYNLDYFPLLLCNHLPFNDWAAHLPPYHSYYIEHPGHILFSTTMSIFVYASYASLRLNDRHKESPVIAFLTAFAVAALAVLILNKHLYNYRSDSLPYWYTITFSIAQLFMLGYILSRIRWSRGRWLGITLTTVLMLAFVTRARALHKDRKHRLMDPTRQTNWLDAAYWLRDHAPSDARVAAYNAGIIGLFSERQVMNLDGLVNSPAYFREVLQLERTDGARAKRNLLNLLRSKDITYFADIVPASDPSYWPRAFADDQIKVSLQELFRTDSASDGNCGAVYRLDWAEH